jgi:hypothetical protein
MQLEIDFSETVDAVDIVQVDQLAGDHYRAFTAADTTPEAARLAFVMRYGIQPAEVRPAIGGLLLVGPLPPT